MCCTGGHITALIIKNIDSMYWHFVRLAVAGYRSHSALADILNQAEVFIKKSAEISGCWKAQTLTHSLIRSLPSVGRSFHQIAEYSLSIQSTFESSILLMLDYARMEVALDLCYVTHHFPFRPLSENYRNCTVTVLHNTAYCTLCPAVFRLICIKL